ncbi:MAG: alpha/beta fold hydrolase [Flavobacteriales bacterium]|nr:alpha/beta fold hydrolase [Flavobacteriales bacterium]MBL4733933.1 alpha/beta fold hydrolase [Flavobacteriales bacterium]
MARDRGFEEESIFIPVNDVDQLHVKRFYKNPEGVPLFLIHGSIENGKIFYSSSGKGLAPYLAMEGFDVFAVDLRGRGKSTPCIDKHATHGLTNSIEEDIPAVINKIREIKGDIPQHWLSHSWGGVNLLAYLAKHSNEVKLNSMVFFAAKRHISIRTLRKFYLIDGLWNIMGRYAVWKNGFLPALKIKMGADNESARCYKETNDWVYQPEWLDWRDQFDYAAALQKIDLPPILSITGAGDKVLGHPTDCQYLLNEIKPKNFEFKILGKEAGNLQDYDHINILTHPDAVMDQFPMARDWILKHK